MSATDDRIQKILNANVQKTKEAEQHKKEAEDAEIARQAREKWVEDTYTIADILSDFEQRMAKINLHLRFQDAGKQGGAIAVGRISGSVSGKELQLTLHLHSDGDIHAFRAAAKIGPANQIEFAFDEFPVLTADRAKYESLILDAIEAT